MAPGAKAQNRGFAYVDFASPDSKAIAISLSEGHLLGRRLLIKDGDDYEGRPVPLGADGKPVDPTKMPGSGVGLSKTAQKILRSQKQPPAPTLFLGNLGFEATEKSIRELFEAHRVTKPLVKKAKKDKRVPKEKKPAADSDEEEKDDSDSESEADDPEVDSDRDSDIERMVTDGVEAAKVEAPKRVHVQDIWIRKVRMGTFEDSGLCKGWAFVDFGSIEHATAVLINPKNHLLDGRKLTVEYASADAVRRGGGGPKIEGAVRGRGGRRGGARGGGGSAPVVVDAPVENKALNKAGRIKGPQFRPKPGAALALAKRESAAIIPSQGQKTKF